MDTRQPRMAPVALSSSVRAPVQTCTDHAIFERPIDLSHSPHYLGEEEGPNEQALLSVIMGKQWEQAILLGDIFSTQGSGQRAGHLWHIVLAGLAQVVIEAPVRHAAFLLRTQLVFTGRPVVGRIDVRQKTGEHARLAGAHVRAVRHPLGLLASKISACIE